MSSSIKRRGAVLFATAALATVGALGGTAQASSSTSLWVGYGQANAYNSVRCVQLISNSLHWQTGYHTVAVDGAFGKDTDGAIHALQHWAGLDEDGVVGPKTGETLLIATKDAYGCNAYLPTTR
ncbi:peptidoglycan-binding protein [Streptomyces sp. NPDC059070]|uniref:peptidoglycan-binding domain-containing protein n=1 Tax=unclassified Streptomyces TaxID=2593676 RepID=UPI0034E20B4C